MNWAQFKDPVRSYMCIAYALIATWSLTQEVEGSNSLNDKLFVTEFAEFSENI